MLMTSSCVQLHGIKGALFKPLYLLNYMSYRVETLHVSTEGSVIDKKMT